MNTASGSYIERTNKLRIKLLDNNILLLGNPSIASREFETKSSINDRIGSIQGALYNCTSGIPKFYKDSYDIASKQLGSVLSVLKSIDSELLIIEKELEMNNAPYTPGRWPEWK
jgi:hypothetical protein